MKRQALETLRSAIEANTERRSIEELRAQGKRHVRIVSGDKVMKIIRAVVADIVDREVGEISQRDRERIEQRTQNEFDRVLKMQAEQDALLQDQKELVKEYKTKLERLSTSVGEADARIGQLRDDLVSRDLELERMRAERDTLTTRAGEDAERLEQTQEALRKSELELERMRGEQDSQTRRATKSSKRLTELQETALDREMEAKRLSSELETLQRRAAEDHERLDQVQEALKARDLELERLRGEREALAAELVAAREQAQDSQAVSSFRSELSEMRAFLNTMEERAAHKEEETVNTLLAKLDAQAGADTRALEDRFSGTLDDALDRITKTMEVATARPIDIVVEATDVLVDKLFDMEETEMSHNLDSIEVEERSSSTDISRNLARLKKMRGSQAEQEQEQAESEEKQEEEDASRGPEADSAQVSSAESARMNASVDRLKAVREGAGSDENA